MAERIERHRAERPPAWQTVEEPRRLGAALVGGARGRLRRRRLPLAVGCEPVRGTAGSGRRGRGGGGRSRWPRPRAGTTIAVSNEVGLGVVPATSLGRAYRDVLGRVNASWVGASSRAYLVVAGRALRARAAGAARCLSSTGCSRGSAQRTRQRARAAQRAFDLKTKPRGSLGRLEAGRCPDRGAGGRRGAAAAERRDRRRRRRSRRRRGGRERLPARGDARRWSPTSPQAGRRSTCSRARRTRALVVVDAGVVEPCADPAVRSHRFGAGTANIARGPAMPRDVGSRRCRGGRRARRRAARRRLRPDRGRRDGDREHDLGARPLRVSAPRRAGRGLRSRNRDRRRGAQAQDRGRRPRARRQRPGRAGSDRRAERARRVRDRVPDGSRARLRRPAAARRPRRLHHRCGRARRRAPRARLGRRDDRLAPLARAGARARARRARARAAARPDAPPRRGQRRRARAAARPRARSRC